MKAEREAFIEQIRILDRDALLSLVASLYDEMEEIIKNWMNCMVKAGGGLHTGTPTVS